MEEKSASCKRWEHGDQSGMRRDNDAIVKKNA
jgi:hypothetical protein